MQLACTQCVQATIALLVKVRASGIKYVERV